MHVGAIGKDEWAQSSGETPDVHRLSCYVATPVVINQGSQGKDRVARYYFTPMPEGTSQNVRTTVGQDKRFRNYGNYHARVYLSFVSFNIHIH